MLGNSKFIVTVDVDLNTDQLETFKERVLTSKGRNYMMPAIEDEMLPGIPQRQNFEMNSGISENNPGEKIVNRSVKMPANIFNRISATVLLDKKASKTDIESVKKMLPVILGMNSKRGDAVKVVTIQFKGSMFSLMGMSKNLRDSFFVSVLLYIALFALIAGVIVLFFNKAKELFGEISPFLGSKEKDAARDDALAAEKNKKEEESEKKEAEKKRFSFVKDEDATRLKYFLMNQAPEIVASVLCYLKPQISAEVLSQLPGELKDKVVLNMATPTIIDNATLNALEEEIRAGIDGTRGGIEDFVGILENLSNDDAKVVLSSLDKANPMISKIIRSMNVSAEDLIKLSAPDMQTLVSACDIKDVSIVVKFGLPALSAKIRASLNEESAQMVAEYIELVNDPPAKAINEALTAVIRAAKELAKAGKIRIAGLESIESVRKRLLLKSKKLSSRLTNERVAARQNPLPVIDEKDSAEPTLGFQPASAKTALQVTDVAPAIDAFKGPIGFHMDRETDEPAVTYIHDNIMAEVFDGITETVQRSNQPDMPEINPSRMKGLASVDKDELDQLLSIVTPKTLAVALQSEDSGLIERIKKVSPSCSSRITMYSSIIGKQSESKVEQAVGAVEKALLNLGNRW